MWSVDVHGVGFIPSVDECEQGIEGGGVNS
jgi:hypothetical protein